LPKGYAFFWFPSQYTTFRYIPGQEALDNSVQVKDTSTRRVGVNEANDEIVVLDKTHQVKVSFMAMFAHGSS
jgi:hypothetical protein